MNPGFAMLFVGVVLVLGCVSIGLGWNMAYRAYAYDWRIYALGCCAIVLLWPLDWVIEQLRPSLGWQTHEWRKLALLMGAAFFSGWAMVYVAVRRVGKPPRDRRQP